MEERGIMVNETVAEQNEQTMEWSDAYTERVHVVERQRTRDGMYGESCMHVEMS